MIRWGAATPCASWHARQLALLLLFSETEHIFLTLCPALLFSAMPGLQDEDVRQSVRAQFSALCAKLDALSHLHFT
jgi:hypothetical protein